MAAAAKKTAPKTAVRAAETEQEADGPQLPVEIEHGGYTYAIPVGLDAPLELLEAESDIEAIRAVVGEDQWKTYRDSKPTLRDFREFSQKVLEASGVDDMGN